MKYKRIAIAALTLSLFLQGCALLEHKKKHAGFLLSEMKSCLADAATGMRNPALVLDIDDTALNTSATYTYSNLNEFFDEAENKDAQAIPEILDLYKYAKSQDIKVFFVTARTDCLREATERSLKKAGYVDHDGLYMNTRGILRDSQIGAYKARIRRSLECGGYEIKGNVGDKKYDLVFSNEPCSRLMPKTNR
jgi:predicted secreted acid phosphatase